MIQRVVLLSCHCDPHHNTPSFCIKPSVRLALPMSIPITSKHLLSVTSAARALTDFLRHSAPLLTLSIVWTLAIAEEPFDVRRGPAQRASFGRVSLRSIQIAFSWTIQRATRSNAHTGDSCALASVAENPTRSALTTTA